MRKQDGASVCWIAKTIRKMKLARWRGEDLHKYTVTRAAEEFSNIIYIYLEISGAKKIRALCALELPEQKTA